MHGLDMSGWVRRRVIYLLGWGHTLFVRAQSSSYTLYGHEYTLKRSKRTHGWER